MKISLKPKILLIDTENGIVQFGGESGIDEKVNILINPALTLPTGVGYAPNTKLLVTREGEYEVNNIRLYVSSKNDIWYYLLVIEGMNVVVVPNVPEKIPASELEELEGADVLIVMTTQESSIKNIPEIIAQIEPRQVIIAIDNGDADAIRHELGRESLEAVPNIVLNRRSLPAALTITALSSK